MTEALTAALVVDTDRPRDPALSPDGRRLAYVRAPAAEIWVRDGDGDVRRATADTATESLPRWSADSRTLYFLSDRGSPGVPQLHRLTLPDPQDLRLTGWPTGIAGYEPFGGLIALITEPEPPGIIVAGRNEPLARLRLLDPGTGTITTPDVFAGRHVVQLRQRPDGAALAVLTRQSADNDYGPRTGQLHLLDPVTGTAEDLGPAETDARDLTWWPDGDGWRLGYLALTPPGLQAGTAVFDLRAGNRTVNVPMCPTQLCQTAGAPLVVLADGLDTRLARLDPGGLTLLSHHRGHLGSLTAGADKIAALAGTRDRPLHVRLGTPDGPLRPVTGTRKIALGAQERLAYRASDGLGLDGLLVLPPGKTGPLPLVTIVHGGPYDRYADRLHLDAQWLAAAGYAVFLPNPRGGQGHGHAFAASVAGRAGREEFGDIMTGIDLLTGRGIADPSRLGISGWSHGGFMAAWAISQTHRFRAAVVGAGIADWGMLAATGENGQFETALGGSTGWEGTGPHPHDALSPVSYARDIRTPVLILHGDSDTNVPYGQAVYLHRALRHYGAEHEFVTYPGEGHVFRSRAHRIDVLNRTRDWFDSRL